MCTSPILSIIVYVWYRMQLIRLDISVLLLESVPLLVPLVTELMRRLLNLVSHIKLHWIHQVNESIMLLVYFSLHMVYSELFR